MWRQKKRNTQDIFCIVSVDIGSACGVTYITYIYLYYALHIAHTRSRIYVNCLEENLYNFSYTISHMNCGLQKKISNFHFETPFCANF